MSSRIKAGIVLYAFIKGIPNLFEDFAIEYKPMTPRELATLDAEMERFEDTAAQTDHQAKAIAKRITKWTETEETETGTVPVPVSWEVLSEFQPRLNNRIIGIVRGWQAPDNPDMMSDAWAMTQQWIAKQTGSQSGSVVEAIRGN